MRKRLIPLLAAFAITVDSPPHVEAGAFATEYTQLLNHAQLVMEYIRQGEQLANEIRMYADMIRNSQVLGGQLLGSIASDINGVANIVRGGQALAYSLGNLDQLFRTTYPGYQTTPGAYYLNYRRWSQTSLDTALGVLRAAGLPTQSPLDTRLHSSRVPPLSPYEIKAGWEIPAILEQSLNSDLPGELKALVASDVYDTATGVYVLIPQGSRLVGRYDSRISYGQDGVQVVWNRIIFPDASTIDLNGMAGLDTHGNAGLRDQVDRHYRRLIGFSMLTSVFNAGFAFSQQRNQSVLVNPSAGQIAASAVGQEVSQAGAEITRRNLNVQPTIKVPAGYRFTVRANRDILFEAPYAALEPVLGQAGR